MRDRRQTLTKTGGDVEYIDKAKNNVEHWKGLCLRGFDYSQVPLFQIDQLDTEMFEEEAEEEDAEMEEMRLKYLGFFCIMSLYFYLRSLITVTETVQSD